MKKTLLIAIAGIFSSFGFAQTTATDFTANDCASGSHTLFSELDGGNIVVITWVMPCGSCINFASSIANTVQGFSSSNPGKVKMYLADDYANSNCSTVDAWANTNNITADATFSNASIKMADYGSTGMRKVVVVGGTNHKVYLNQTTSVSASALQTAINTALNTTAISETNNAMSGLSLFPNPVVNNPTIYYTLNTTTNVSIDVLNILGEKVSTITPGIQGAGKQELQANMSFLRNGVYFIKLNAGEASRVIKFTVAH